MPKNHFKAIRNSYFTGSILTCLLSNIIVFGQPIEQMYQRTVQLKSKQFFYSGFTHNTSTAIKNHNDVPTENNTPDKTVYKKSEASNVFYAQEKQGLIGQLSSTEKENPNDNFFTIILPDSFNSDGYDVVLQYHLFGVEGAEQTTKSINNHVSYGGQSIKINEIWSEVEEYIPSQYVKPGKNEIFFTRRANENYQYEIKDLRIKFLEKRNGSIFLTQNNLKNFQGTVHLLGYTPKNIGFVSVLGETIPVNDGIFETLLTNVPPDTEHLKITYGANQKELGAEDFEVDYYPNGVDHTLSETSNSNDVAYYNPTNNAPVEFHALSVKDDAIETSNSVGGLLIRGLNFKDVRPLNTDVENVTLGAYMAYRLESAGLENTSTTKLHLKYDETKIPDGYSAKDVRTFSYNKENREWSALPVDSLDYENNTVITTYNGDTDYINGVIKVPEMPETSSFTPTTITDMEYANPAAGIVSIATPSPNFNGSAATGFPIKLPSGRNGMSPSLSVNYSSEGGNGWMGLGWDMQLPAITLDTRWGVPRFLPTVESEIYQLNGETMVMKIGTEYTNPHRNISNINRTTSKTFHLRKEGSYLKIERLGSNPSSYHWRVTDKYGNVSLYGTNDNTKIRDGGLNEGNVTHWALYQTMDPYGNYVEYEYDKGVADPGETNNVAAQYFYPKTIKYTLSQATFIPNHYQVDFTRKNYTVGGSGSISRTDVSLNARTGAMMATHELLTEVKVSLFDGQLKPIRTYRFDYTESVFKKMQLSKISEYDTAGNLFYSNTMEYYNDIGSGPIINTNSVTWSASADGIEGPLDDIAPGSFTIPSGSILGTGTTTGFSAGLRAGLGIGVNTSNVTTTVGGSYNYSQSQEKTRVSFIDINGDGLPDKVYKPNSGGLKYLPNLGTGGNGNGIFGQVQNVDNINNLDNTKSRTNTFGGDANLFGVVGVGKSRSKTRVATGDYFTDFNGDGLPDVISGGTVKFNKTSPWTDPSTVNFTNDVALTQNPIVAGTISTSVSNIIISELETKDEFRSEHPQFDHVKAWEAPYSGTITISGSAWLRAKNDCANANEQNQFRLWIERASENQTTPAQVVANSEKNFTTVGASQSYSNSMTVTKGDMLFFRIHNKTYGCGGEMEWNPTVTYTSAANIPSNTANENGENFTVFNAQEDYMMNNGSGWNPVTESVINIDWNLPDFSVNQFSDDFRIRIEKITRQHQESGENIGEVIGGPTSQILTRTYNHQNNSFSAPNSITGFTNVANQFGMSGGFSYEYRFYVESDSNVNWGDINWQPIITQSGVQHYPSITYTIYDDNVNQSNYRIFGSSFPTPSINNDGNNPMLRLNHDMFSTDYSEFLFPIKDEKFPLKINWVVKEHVNGITKTLYKRTFYLHRLNCEEPIIGDDYCNYEFRSAASGGFVINTSNTSYFQFDLIKSKVQEIKNASGRIYSAFYLENQKFGKNNAADITLSLHPNEQGNYTFTTQTLDSPFFTLNPTFYGMTYRGWGQFLYNGGIKYDYNEEGEITNPTSPELFDGVMDMSVFDHDADPNDIEDQIENPDLENMDLNSVVRYALYGQENAIPRYRNTSLKNSNEAYASYGFNNSSQLTALVGRFAEPDIYELWTDPQTLFNGGAFVGLKQRSESKGKATSGNISIPSGSGFSGTASNGNSKVLNQYIDLNGDRYPDIVIDGKIQFTDMKGGLSTTAQNTIDNTFVSGSKSKDNTIGVTISGAPPNSTQPDNASMNSPTITNVNSGINTSSGNSFDSKQWNDINGDGLPDKVTISKTDGNVKVRLNTGYGFSDEIIWGSNYEDLDISTRSNAGFGSGFGNASFAAGFGAAASTAKLNAALMDVNGDGLPDLVIKSNTNDSYSFHLNTGTGFETGTASQSFHNNIIDQDQSVTGNVFGSFTFGFGFTLFLINFKITFTPTAGVNAGVNEKQITVQDIDGDGLPDVLTSGANNGSLTAKLNKVGRTHLLKTVNLPLGGSWTVDYKREGNTFDMPQNQWTLNKIVTNDGFNADVDYGPNQTLTTILYEDPKHDRREREFLGFGKVRVDQKDPDTESTFRYTVTEYHTENIYLKGLQKLTHLYDDADNLLSENTTLYSIMDPDSPQVTSFNATELQSGLDTEVLDRSRLFVAPVKTVSTSFENGDGLSIEQRFTDYDAFGNLLAYRNYGDTYTAASADDAYRTEMEYYASIPNVVNSTGFVKNIRVYRQNGNQLLRQREAQYYRGKLTNIKTKLNATETNSISLEYDEDYGNMITATLDNGFETTIEYDPLIATYPVEVSNTFGETSYSSYDYLFGIPVLTTDTNGKMMRTRIDNRGRLVEITAPNEMPGKWTIRMQYKNGTGLTAIPPTFNGTNYMVTGSGNFQAIAPGGSQPTAAKIHALTRHNVQNNATATSYNQLLTVSLVDGLGQAIQLKKTLLVNSTGSNQLKWLISGKETKDAFGRVIEARLPTFQLGYPTNPDNISASAFTYVSGQNTIPATEMTYDSRDRILTVKQPGESQMATTEYSIADGMFVTTVTNELAQTMQSFTDVRGRQRKTVQNGELTTEFYYNAVGEKIKVKNQQGYETFYKYDLAGRRIEERHPDHGLQVFKYDTSGNMIERYTSNLLIGGQQNPILYEYSFNRLMKVKYPLNPENDITYSYGIQGNTEMMARNAVGRLYMQQDASGVQGFGYDNMGNLKTHLRGVAVASRHTFWYHTRWVYDSFNRVHRITYPDGEEVTYNYNMGGELNSVTSNNPNSSAPIVSNIYYNDLGERTKIAFGNGTTKTYTYDTRRRLQDLGHQFNGFAITNQYAYDALSNIAGVSTLDPQNNLPGVGELGGPISHSYTYDNYNRLTEASGTYTGPNDTSIPLLVQTYTLGMEYDLAHNIISKTQTHTQGTTATYGGTINNLETMVKTNYHLDYGGYATGVNVSQGLYGEYGYVQPHAAREIIEAPDENVPDTDPRYKKTLIDYDANGNQLAVKQVVYEGEQPDAIEGVIQPVITTMHKNLWDEEDRLRAVDLNPEERNPHPLAVYTYDAAGMRAVRYVPGRIDAWSNGLSVSSNERDEVMLYPSPMLTAKALSKFGIAPQEGDLVSSYTKHYYIGSERVSSSIGTAKDLGLYPPKIEGFFPTIRGFANQSVTNAYTGLSHTYNQLGQDPSPNTQVLEGDLRSFTKDPGKYDAYWYHSDHLGSSAYISNRFGKVTQHMEYLPFGETLVDEHLNSYNSPFKFNGKELDAETGNYYYGARYYNPKWSIWLSVDPLAEKYPSISSYAYVANNPIMFIDPNGKEIIIGRIKGMSDKDYNQFKRETLNNLQALTDNVLEVDKNGKVIETGCGGTATCSEGSNLVSVLINSDKKVTIVKSTQKNRGGGSNVTYFDNGYASIKEDGTANLGSGSTIYFNPLKITGGIDENGKNGRPSKIGLGHELGHARDGVLGIDDITSMRYNPRVIDPDVTEEGGGLILTRNEYKARQFENVLRDEQGGISPRQTNYLKLPKQIWQKEKK